jgi:hypothetical protein
MRILPALLVLLLVGCGSDVLRPKVADHDTHGEVIDVGEVQGLQAVLIRAFPDEENASLRGGEGQRGWYRIYSKTSLALVEGESVRRIGASDILVGDTVRAIAIGLRQDSDPYKVTAASIRVYRGD